MKKTLFFLFLSAIVLVLSNAYPVSIAFEWLVIVGLFSFRIPSLTVFVTTLFMDICLLQIPGTSFLIACFAMICLSLITDSWSMRIYSWILLVLVLSLLGIFWYHEAPISYINGIAMTLAFIVFMTRRKKQEYDYE